MRRFQDVAGVSPPHRERVALAFLAIVLSLGFAHQGHADERFMSPLEPPDTSSPRATLKSFRENFYRAWEDFYRLRIEEEIDRAAQARSLRTLEQSKLPPVQAWRLAAEASFLLNEVLDKVALPPWEQIPDAEAMAALPADEPRRWRVPGTEITIERISEGPRAGEYLISAESVARAYEFYKRAENLPYKPGALENFYETAITHGGTWVPIGMVEALPGWARAVVARQAVWKWIAMILTIAAWIAIVYYLRRLSRPVDDEPRYWLRFFLTLAILPLTRFLRWFMDQQLIIAGTVFEVVDSLVVILYFLIGAAAIVNLGRAIGASLVKSPRVDKDSIDAHLITVGSRAIAWLAAILLLAKGASDLGVPLAAVVTSLGVGGLAFAMAARPTLENLIAGVTLYLDKPVKVGQFCQYHDVLGTVERIGLRSTRIRRWGGNLLSVPNSQFAEFQLDNYNDARYIWIRQRIRLRYETSPDQLRFVLAKLREMLFSHPKVLLPRVRLVGFYDDALKIEILGYTDTGVWAEWHAIREDVFLRVLEIVEASGTRLALPSQTTYFARDDGVDDEKKRAAEEQVHEWTEKGELPFPDMTEEQREALKGTLDFPPKGSIEHKKLTESDALDMASGAQEVEEGDGDGDGGGHRG